MFWPQFQLLSSHTVSSFEKCFVPKHIHDLAPRKSGKIWLCHASSMGHPREALC